MKILTIIKSLMLLTLASSQYAFSMCSEEVSDPGVHTPYLSYDANQYGAGTPSIGYRYQKKDIILDATFGYKYFVTADSMHFGTASANVFYSFFQTENIQIYGGIGCAVNYLKGKDYYYYEGFYGDWLPEKIKINEIAICPMISIGQDIKLGESKKLFIELYYRPWSYGNGYRGELHMTGLKVGVGI